MSEKLVKHKPRRRSEKPKKNPEFKKKKIKKKTLKGVLFLLFLHPAVPLSLRAQFSQSHSVTNAHLKV